MAELAHSPEKWIKKYVKDVSLKPIHNDNPVKVSDIDNNVVYKPYETKADGTSERKWNSERETLSIHRRRI